MIKNNIKTSFRNIWKKKEFTFVNLVGVAIATASVIFIVTFIDHELSYDRFFTRGKDIYKFVLERKYPNYTTIAPYVPHSFTNIAMDDFPEVENATSVCGPFNNMLITYKLKDLQEINFLENSVYAADSNFFSIFDFKFLKGNPKTALLKPKSMVLTESAAKRHFADENPLGKVIRMSNDDFIVTGVCQDPPTNTHFKFELVISIHTIGRFNQVNYSRSTVHTYLLLRPDADSKALESKFPKMVDAYAAGEIENINGVSWKDYKLAGNMYHYFLVPLQDVYLYPENLGGMKEAGSINGIRILIGIACLILLIATINFTNLSTARSAERAKEVGVRKVLGSVKRQLVYQFLTESIILSFIGMMLGLLLLVIAFPYMNDITNSSFGVQFNAITFVTIFLFVVISGVLAGLYPAFVLSSYSPTVVFRGNFTGNLKGRWLRNGLMIFQFWISIVLVISSSVIEEQMEHIDVMDIGFKKGQLMVVERTSYMEPSMSKTFVEEIRNIPKVQAAAGSLSVPGFQGQWEDQYQVEGTTEVFTAQTIVIGDDFSEVLGLQLLEGRLYSSQTVDSMSVMLNEAAVIALNLTNPVGKKIYLNDKTNEDATPFTIAGVVKNFNFEPLTKEIRPLIIQSDEFMGNRIEYAIIRLESGFEQETINKVEEKWKQFLPAMPFTFRFVDEVLDANYKGEYRMGKVVKIFSYLSIFISCIGLFALSAYTISLRTKEISIRKVIGANVSQILLMLLRDVTRLIVVAFVLACPIAWYLMDKWLEKFAFHIDISVWTLALSGCVVLFIAWLTVSYQSAKVAIKNPVESLKGN